MADGMAKKHGRARFYLSCNDFYTLYFLVKMLLVKLKSLHTSVCWNINYGTKKTETKNVKALNMAEFISTFDQYPHKFKFGHLVSSIILGPFC